MRSTVHPLLTVCLLAIAACDDEQTEPAPAPGAVATTLEVQVVDASGTPIEDAEIYYLGDIDWREPSEAELAALKKHGSDQEELVKNLGKRVRSSGSTCFLPVPKDWGIATGRKGTLYGELNLAPGSIGRNVLKLAPAEQLWIELVDRDGNAVAGRRLTLAIQLASSRSVMYPLGETNELGRLDLTSVHKKLRRYRSDGETVEGLSLYSLDDGEERVVKMFDPVALPRGLVRVEQR